MANLNRVWFPRTEGLTETQRAALMVPYQGQRQQMNRSILLSLLAERLSNEIMSDVPEARQALLMSEDVAPELAGIQSNYQPKEWGRQIARSDGMNQLLARLDWNQEIQNGYKPLPQPEAISLRETLEQIV
jgi:hypothetical protein